MSKNALNPKYIIFFIFYGVYHTASEDIQHILEKTIQAMSTQVN